VQSNADESSERRSGGQSSLKGRSTLRLARASLIVAGIVLLAFFFGSGTASAQTQSRQPTGLWQAYPLDPHSEQGANLSVQGVRSAELVRIPTLVKARSSKDSTLLIGGLALIVLLISDTSFLVLTRRALAKAGD
jgi:hypothetical protein